MLIGVMGASGSIGTRHTRNLVAMGHQVRGFDPRPLPSDLMPHSLHDNNPFDPAIEALVIATPTFMHKANILDAIAGNVRRVFVEKPLTLTDRILSRATLADAADAGVHISVGYNLRFHPAVQKAKSSLNEIHPIAATFWLSQYKQDYEQADHVIDHWATHEIDLALFFFGPAVVDYAKGDHDVVDVVLQHRGGIRSHIHADYLAREEIRYCRIAGETGNIEIDLVADPVTNIHYMDEMKAFIKGGTGLASASEALDVVQICMQIRNKL